MYLIHFFQSKFYISFLVMTSVFKSDENQQISIGHFSVLSLYIAVFVVTVLREIWTSQIQYMSSEDLNLLYYYV